MGCKTSRRDGGNDGSKISRRDGGNDGVQDK